MPQVAAVILAAGQGTRMKSKRVKVLHPLCGQPMIHHILRAVEGAGVERVILVVGHQADEVERAAPGAEVVVQAEQLGTGHAVLQAAPLLAEHRGPVLIACGDTPLFRPQTLRWFLDAHRQRGGAATVLTAVLDDPAGYGRIVRDGEGRFIRIVERKDATLQEAAIREVNTGVYCFAAPLLFQALERLKPDNAQGEYYLTDVLAILKDQGYTIEAVPAADPGETLGINDRVELAAAERILRDRILQDLMLAGVTIVDPASTFVDAQVEVGRDTVIHPFTFILGASRIGEDCEIGPHARIADSRIADRVTVDAAIVLQSEISADAVIGPFSYLRPGTEVGPEAKVGAFVETKKSAIGRRSKVPHLSYVGDTTIGEGVNVGAGTITVNYDGVHKHRTVIEDGAFIGSNANLVAPVVVGRGAYVGAGSTITRDVPPDALGIGRARQAVIEGWARMRRGGKS